MKITNLRSLVLISFSFYSIISIKSSDAQTTFSKVFSDTVPFIRQIRAHAIARTADNKYIIAGEDESSAGLIMKIDSAGNLIWNKVYSQTSSIVQFNTVATTSDSGMIVAGFLSHSFSMDIFCLKLKSNGDTMWAKRIASNNNQFAALEVHQTFEGGYILSGHSYGHQYSFSLKLNSGGNLEWCRSFLSVESRGASIKQTRDSGYVVTGMMDDAPNPKAFLMKLSSSGDFLWGKKYGYPSSAYAAAFDVAVTTNGFLLYLDGAFNSVVLKTDSSGNILWQKKFNQYSGSAVYQNYNYTTPKLHQAADGSIVFITGNPIVGPDLVTKIDSTGKLLWTRQLAMSAIAIAETNNGVIVVGNGPTSLGYKSGGLSYQIGVITIDSTGNGNSCIYPYGQVAVNDTLISSSFFFPSNNSCSITPEQLAVDSFTISADIGCVLFTDVRVQETANLFTIYPNPNRGIINISLSKTITAGEVSIINMMGEKVYCQPFNGKEKMVNCKLSRGIYIVQVRSGEEILTKKIAVED